jgi:hypothetical protein
VSRTALCLSGTFAAYQMRTAIEPLLRRAFAEVRTGFEWWNIPPCHLYWARRPRDGWGEAAQPNRAAAGRADG